MCQLPFQNVHVLGECVFVALLRVCSEGEGRLPKSKTAEGYKPFGQHSSRSITNYHCGVCVDGCGDIVHVCVHTYSTCALLIHKVTRLEYLSLQPVISCGTKMSLRFYLLNKLAISFQSAIH